MSLLRRLVAADEAQETRVFLLMAAFGLVVAAIYWLVSYELVGSVLLGAFGLATGLIAARLAGDPASGRVRGRSSRPATAADDLGDTTDSAVGGSGGIDRPFRDESGRIPDETIAPFAVGLGAALASTGLIFGLAPVVVGVLPLAWGAWSWLTAAGDELRATRRDEDRA